MEGEIIISLKDIKEIIQNGNNFFSLSIEELITLQSSDGKRYYLPKKGIDFVGGMISGYIDFRNDGVVLDEIHSFEELDIISRIYRMEEVPIEEILEKIEIIDYYSIQSEKIKLKGIEWDEIIITDNDKILELIKMREMDYISFKMLIADGLVSQEEDDIIFDFSPLWFSISERNNILFGNNLNTLLQIQETDIDQVFDKNHSFINFWPEKKVNRIRKSEKVILFENNERYNRWCSQLNFRLEFFRDEISDEGIEYFIFDSDLDNDSPLLLEIPRDNLSVRETEFYSIDQKGMMIIPQSKTEKVMKKIKENNILFKIVEKFKETGKISQRKMRFSNEMNEDLTLSIKFSTYLVKGYIKMR